MVDKISYAKTVYGEDEISAVPTGGKGNSAGQTERQGVESGRSANVSDSVPAEQTLLRKSSTSW